MENIEEGRSEATQPATKEDESSMIIDLGKIYAFKPEDLTIEISASYYSNLAYMQVAPKDVIIDFLAMPGIKRDGKVAVGGIRVYMSHVQALKMIESLGTLLIRNEKKIERFEIPSSPDVKLSTEITTGSEEKTT